MITITDAMEDLHLFGQWFDGPSWNAWRAVLKAAFCDPMTAREVQLFRSVAGRDPPGRRVRELWAIVSRRGGKDSVASLIAACAAAFTDYTPLLRPGERASVLCLATDRQQAKIVLNYCRAYFEQVPLLRGLVERETADGLELTNGAEIVVSTNSFRAVRGRSIACAIFDEVAFWRDEASATPDKETYAAIRPGMAMLPNAMLIGISSPYRRVGLLYDKWREHYGKAGDVLVIRAPSRTMNPLLPQEVVDAAYADDPESAAAEFGGEFRTDIADFVSRSIVEACIESGVHERPSTRRTAGAHYSAFIDAAGGSGSDSMTCAVAHVEGGIPTLDALRERKPPFSPDDVVLEFAALLQSYGVTRAESDKWGGDWVGEAFRKRNITVVPSAKPKADIYRELLPLLNAHRCALLDHPRLISQLVGLERRTARSGHDSIDHAPGGHDDVANAVAGALLLVGTHRPMVINPEALAQLRAHCARRPRAY